MIAPDPDHSPHDISPDAPCGANLEFDAEFAEFERLCVGKAEQQYGSTVIPAEEPDWKAVIEAGSRLLRRTHDLRIFAQMAVARLQSGDFAGYADMLAMARLLLEARWEFVHPQLDPEDDNDTTLRANALLAAAAPGRVLRALRNLPLARSPQAGVVTWRDVAISTGLVEVDANQTTMSEAAIAAAFRDTDPAGLETLRQALISAIDSVAAIPAAFEAAAGYGTGPDFTELAKLLADIRQTVDRQAVAAALAALPQELAPGGEDVAIGRTARPAAPTDAAGSITALGPVTNRADALRLMDLAIDYFKRNEPSSPLPLLIGRARRLADKGFLDVLRDLAPDGVSQAERIVGEN